MKVLQVNILYNQGSTGKIVADIHKVLTDKNIESISCYGTGTKVKDKNIYKLACHYELSFYRIWAHIVGLQYASGFLSTLRLIRIIKREKPDIVHLHCINGFFINVYRIMAFMKRSNIKTVLTLHAEFMYTGSCGHAFDCEKWKTGCGSCPQLWNASYSWFFDRTKKAWMKMLKAFKGFDDIVITCVSKWLYDRAKQSPLLEGKKIVVIENGLDTKNVFHYTDFSSLKESLGIKDEKILLHVTANFSKREDDLKGGRYIYKLAQRLKDENVRIIIVGSKNSDIEVLSNMINIGRIENQKILAQYYSMANLMVITSKKETFSMPSAEALACGTPVVGFKAGGPETVCLKEYSEFVEYGDMDALTACVKKWITFKSEQWQEIEKASSKYFSKEKMCEKYQQIYESLNE